MSSDPHRPPGREAVAGGPLLVVISGPSGVGKDSLLSRIKERGVRAHVTVTATTRPRRPSSPDDDQQYTSLTEDAFEKLRAEDGLLEHATVYGHQYGVPKAPLAQALGRGEDVLMRVDVQGAASIKKLVPAAVLIFLAPETMEELEARLRDRGQDSPEVLKGRLDAAEREMAERSWFDYTVVNKGQQLDDCVDEVLAIIAKERSRPGRERPTV